MMRHHFTTTKMAVINKADNNKCCQWEDRTLPYTLLVEM